LKEAKTKNSLTLIFSDYWATFSPNFNEKCLKLGANELKRCASLAEIFVLRYEGKYTMGCSSDVMR